MKKNKKILLTLIMMLMAATSNKVGAMNNRNKINNMTNMINGNIDKYDSDYIKQDVINNKLNNLIRKISKIDVHSLGIPCDSEKIRDMLDKIEIHRFHLDDIIEEIKTMKYNKYYLSTKAVILKDWLDIKEKIVKIEKFFVEDYEFKNLITKELFLLRIQELIYALAQMLTAKEEFETNYQKYMKQNPYLIKNTKNLLSRDKEKLLEKDQKKLYCLDKQADKISKNINDYLKTIKKIIWKKEKGKYVSDQVLTEGIKMCVDQAGYLQAYEERFSEKNREFEKQNYDIDKKIKSYKEEVYKNLCASNYIDATKNPNLFNTIREYYHNLEGIYVRDGYKSQIPEDEIRKLFYLFQFKYLYLYIRLFKHTPKNMKRLQVEKKMEEFNKKCKNFSIDPENDIYTQIYAQITFRFYHMDLDANTFFTNTILYQLIRKQADTILYELNKDKREDFYDVLLEKLQDRAHEKLQSIWEEQQKNNMMNNNMNNMMNNNMNMNNMMNNKMNMNNMMNNKMNMNMNNMMNNKMNNKMNMNINNMMNNINMNNMNNNFNKNFNNNWGNFNKNFNNKWGNFNNK